MNQCEFSANLCPNVVTGSCRKSHQLEPDLICKFTAATCNGVRNGTCRLKHKSEVDFCPFPPSECKGVLNGTCRKAHKDIVYCSFFATECAGVRQGTCHKNHRVAQISINDSDVISVIEVVKSRIRVARMRLKIFEDKTLL